MEGQPWVGLHHVSSGELACVWQTSIIHTTGEILQGEAQQGEVGQSRAVAEQGRAKAGFV